MTQKNTEIDKGNKEVAKPLPRVALSKISHVRSELASVYRQAKAGKMDLPDATKFTYILQALARMIADNELEQRIEALEEKQNEQTKTVGEFRADDNFR
jgi:BMFP domain-containing protein YqiC